MKGSLILQGKPPPRNPPGRLGKPRLNGICGTTGNRKRPQEGKRCFVFIPEGKPIAFSKLRKDRLPQVGPQGRSETAKGKPLEESRLPLVNQSKQGLWWKPLGNGQTAE